MKRIYHEINPLFVGLWACWFEDMYGRKQYDLCIVDDFGNLITAPAATMERARLGAEH